MLASGRRTDKPRSFVDVEAHNNGVDTLRHLHAYLGKRRHRQLKYLRDLLADARVAGVVAEIEAAARAWFGGPGADRKHLVRMHEMREYGFAVALAAELEADGGVVA